MEGLLRWLGCGTATAAFAIAACSQSADKSPPIDSVACVDAGPKCGSGANTTTQPPKDAGTDAATDVDAAPPPTTSLAISVGVLDNLFSDQTAIPFKGSGVLSAPTLTGQKDFAIDGDAGSGVVVEGVIVGNGWFQVRPTGNSDLYTTHSLLRVSSVDPVLLVPVIDRIQLGAIFTATSLATPIEQTAGQIIVLFVDDLGKRVSGVRITDSPFAFDGLLYDAGPGVFQIDTGTLRTSNEGIAIFTNVTSGLGSFSYDYQGTVRPSPSMTWVIGQVTVAHVTVSKP